MFGRRTILALFLSASLAAASGAQWSLGVTAPEGYLQASSGGTRAVFRRRLPGRASSTIRVSLSKPREMIPVESYLSGLALPGDDVLEGSEGPTTLGGKTGRRITLDGPSRLKGRSGRVRREMHAAKIDDAHVLVVRADLMYAEKPLAADTLAIVDEALKHVLSTLKIEKGTPAAKPPADATKPPAPGPPDDFLEYSDSTIIPFVFHYPTHWEVYDDTGLVPGSLFVLAAPQADANEAVLRVKVVGHVAELVTAKDVAGRAVDMVRADLKRTLWGASVSDRGSVLSGSARGTLLEYSLDSGEPAHGLVLVATANTTLLVAEATWSSRGGAEARQKAMEVLRTFNVKMSGKTQRVESPAASFDHPASWQIEEYAAAAGERGFGLKSPDGLELVIHAAAIGEVAIDEKTLRSAAAHHLADELKLVTREDIADAETCAFGGASPGLHLNLFDHDATTDIYGLVREGALFFVYMTLPGGVEGHAYGRALQVLLSLRGPDDLAVAQALAVEGERFAAPVAFGHFGLDPYAEDGSLKGATSGRVEFLPDGSVRHWWHAEAQSTLSLGTYRLKGDVITLELDGESAKAEWKLDREAGRLDAATGRPWFLLP